MTTQIVTSGFFQRKSQRRKFSNSTVAEALRQETAGKHAAEGCINILSKEELEEKGFS
jgi:hypothetical protein